MEIAGIDAESIVSQLMQLEARPLTALEARRNAAQVAASAIDQIRSKVDAFRLAADRLVLPASFERYRATSSDTDSVAVGVGTGASTGTLTFTVDRLAQAHGLRSVSTLSSTSIAVTSDAFLAVAAGTSTIGIGTVRAGAGRGAGDLALSVVQASAAASTSGVAPLAATTVIDGSNDSLDVEVDGVARTVTITHGTYDPAGLAAALQDAFAVPGDVVADLTPAGTLSVATVGEGSTASLQITGGSALGALQLGVDVGAHVGIDGVIDVDGVTTTVTAARTGSTVSVDTGAGLLDVTLSGGLRTGDVEVAVVSTGDRSLAAVAAAITAARTGVTAAAVKVDEGAWRLQLSATRTGEGGAIAIDPDALSGLGGLIESSTAQDARITIGSGPGAYTVEASGNTFTDVMSGVTLTAKAVTGSAVTVGVERDDAAIADDVQKMVSAINDVIGTLNVQTRVDPTSGSSGPLAGNSSIRRVADQLRSAIADAVTGLTMSLPSSVGIERTRDGGITFDRAMFLDTIADDPDAVTRLFARGGTATGDVVFAGADRLTQSGAYTVEVTTPATQAASGTLFSGGGVATRLGVRVGGTTVNVDVQLGQPVSEILAELNAAFAADDVDLVAEVDGTGVRIRSTAWGHAGDFELDTDVLGGGSWTLVTGTDVAGTIDGLLAQGSGRRLSLPTSAVSAAAGLAVEVAGGVSGPLGAVDYAPGIAGRIVEVASGMTRVDTGQLTNAKAFADRRIEDFEDQIARLEDRLDLREANLRRQWSAMQTLLSGLQSQGSWLGSQLASLNTNWAPS